MNQTYSNRHQGIILVLFALRELGGLCTKQEVLKFIQVAGLYEITRHDLPPYEGQNESKYHTLLAWARKDALLAGWLIPTKERNAWQLSREGRTKLDHTLIQFRTRELTVSNCYLWTSKFKRQLDPAYEPSSRDAIRPEDRPLAFYKAPAAEAIAKGNLEAVNANLLSAIGKSLTPTPPKVGQKQYFGKYLDEEGREIEFSVSDRDAEALALLLKEAVERSTQEGFDQQAQQPNSSDASGANPR